MFYVKITASMKKPQNWLSTLIKCYHASSPRICAQYLVLLDQLAITTNILKKKIWHIIGNG